MSELKHFGVLGMRWGVRRASTIAGAERGRGTCPDARRSVPDRRKDHRQPRYFV